MVFILGVIIYSLIQIKNLNSQSTFSNVPSGLQSLIEKSTMSQ